MKQKPKVIGVYNYTVILTYTGMLAGVCGILSAFNENRFLSIVMLLICAFCDMFDGTVASTMKRTDEERYFGMQIDTLSDLITFGVLPAAIHYAMSSRSVISLCISGFYVLCALIRLAWFAVDEAAQFCNGVEKRSVYLGMPVTMAAFFVPISYCLTGWLNNPYIMPFVMVLAAILFITPVEIKKANKVMLIIFIFVGFAELAMVLLAPRI